jgi:epidermal growth factor receptor substrate 15
MVTCGRVKFNDGRRAASSVIPAYEALTCYSDALSLLTMSGTFQATPAELSLVNQIFKQHDTQKIGILTGDVAVRVFGGAKLPPTLLGEIWTIADEENNGWLSKKGVAIALRLIGWAQKGEPMSKALVNRREPQFTVITGLTLTNRI